MENSTQTLIGKVRQWFSERDLNHAVVGFSGGIDSATTAALLDAAGIDTTIVCAFITDQERESDYNVARFADLYPHVKAKRVFFDVNLFTNEGKEAALPIIRNAYFYGIAAELRAMGKRPVVVGTVNFDEAAYLGFWGKASDGAQDYYPISHLHKSEVYTLAKELGVPDDIIQAIPSGDLQWSGDLNDYNMIGATYDQIEAVAKFADKPCPISSNVPTEIVNFINDTVDDPNKFIDNIYRNIHKYINPFPGVHAYKKLELFRNRSYSMLSYIATNLTAHRK